MDLRKNVFACALTLCAVSATAVANPFSDFEDGSLEGWSIHTPGTGEAFLEPTGGNPGGFMVTTDVAPGGPAVQVVGPPLFSGDLTGYTAIAWDALVYDNGGFTTRSIKPCVFGSDGTRWIHPMPLEGIGQWRSYEISFASPDWSGPSEGSMTFEEALADGTIGFYTDTSDLAAGTREAGLDNILLIPEPTTLGLLLIGAAMLRRRA